MSNSNNNPFGRVMEEEELMRSISSYSQSRRCHHDHHQPLMLINPTATEELQYQDTVVTTPFLTKTYELVDDQTTNHVVSWGKGNNSFVIWDVQMFSINILPRYFKHNNFSSFVRQLNTYGFRKIEIDTWEFANEDFLRGHKHLLGTIKRRKPPPYPPPPHHHHQPSGQNQDHPCVEVGRVSLNQEIDRQRRGKQILMEELVRARQQQQQTKSYLKEMELRLQTTENKQQQIMTFMSIALQDTNFLEQMTQIEKRKDAEEASIQNKRRRTINQQGQCSNNIAIGQQGFIHDHDNLYGVPINLQEQYMVKEDNGKLIVGEERSFDERFWEGVEDEIDALRYQNALESQNVGYHAQPFAQQFNYLHS